MFDPVNASLKIDMIAYYDFNQNVTLGMNITDVLGLAPPGKPIGNVTSVIGLLNNAVKFGRNVSATRGAINLSNSTYFDFPNAITLAVWINDSKNIGGWVLAKDNGPAKTRDYAFNANGNIQINGLATLTTNCTGIINGLNNSWRLMIYTGNASNNWHVYLNGNTDCGVGAWVSPSVAMADAYIGGRGYSFTSDPNEFFNGTMDEMIIWNRSITADERNTIYNNGVPIPDINVTANDNLTINLIYPPNDFFSENFSTFSFNYTSGNLSILNCSLFVDNVFRVSNKTTNNNVNTNFTFNVLLNHKNWSVVCNDTSSEVRILLQVYTNVSLSPGVNFTIKPNASIGVTQPQGQNSTIGLFSVNILGNKTFTYNIFAWLIDRGIPSSTNIYMAPNSTLSTAVKLTNWFVPKWYNQSSLNDSRLSGNLTWSGPDGQVNYSTYIYIQIPKNDSRTGVLNNISNISISFTGVPLYEE